MNKAFKKYGKSKWAKSFPYRANRLYVLKEESLQFREYPSPNIEKLFKTFDDNAYMDKYLHRVAYNPLQAAFKAQSFGKL